jgi:Restriction endonuclease
MSSVELPSRYSEAESFVANLLQSSGWQLERSHDSVDRGADLILERGGQRFAVEIKALAEGRADRALPLLSLAILQAKAHAREIKGAKPLAVLWVGHASPNLASHLRAFAENYAEGVAVGVVSENGFRHFVGQPFDELNAEPRNEKWRASRSSYQVVNLFSDLNQWMLKILLAHEIPEDLLSAPRIDCRSGAELAAAAGASAMSASRFLQQLRNEGFLEEYSQRPRLVRRRDLFERWRAAVLRPVPEMAMRFVLRAPVREQLQELIAKQSGKACLGLFAAAEELKFGHVSGVPAYVFVPKLPQSDDRQWRGLRPASPGDTPDVILRQAAFPHSMFRGAVRRGGWFISDVIQTWLDVGNHPARGAEQADLIYAKSLRQIVEPGSP